MSLLLNMQKERGLFIPVFIYVQGYVQEREEHVRMLENCENMP